jgi:hypothetical protein
VRAWSVHPVCFGPLLSILPACSDVPPLPEPAAATVAQAGQSGQSPQPSVGEAGQPGQPGEPAAELPSDLLERVRAEDYRSWARAPGYETRTVSAGPHGGEVDIYVNQTLSAALGESGLTEWPVGSEIAKDGFKDGERVLTAVMRKQSSGWDWAEYSAEDRKYAGSISVCIGCHQSGSDFVRAFGFPG